MVTEARLRTASVARAQDAVRARSLADFSQAVSTSFVPLRVSAEQSTGFFARIASTQADSVTVTEVVARPHLVERTAETIACGGSGYYKVSLLLAGSGVLAQNGRELLMQPGDLTVYDTSRPYSLLFCEDFRNLVLMFPKDQVELPSALTDQLAAAPLSAENPALSQVLAAFLSQFPEQLVSLDDGVRAKLGRTALSLLGTLFSSVLDAEQGPRDPHQVLLQKIHDHIDRNLSSPDLTPGSIAAAHFISTRHLHSLFRQAGTTVSTCIRERRLARCRADLADPMFSDRPVSAIAMRWGFTDPAHFSRVFKAAYGVPPSEIRGS